jgi:hypothetical protein
MRLSSFYFTRFSWCWTIKIPPGKRRLNFANFITKERLNFPAVNRYRLDIMTLGNFMTGKLSAH